VRNILLIFLIHIFCVLPKENLKIDDKKSYNYSTFDSLSIDKLCVAQIKLSYVGRREKSITTLLGYTVMLCITDISLVALYSLGIPDIIILRLSSLINRPFYSRSDFINNIKRVIGKNNTDIYGSKIMNMSIIPLGNDINMSNYSIINNKHESYKNDNLVKFKKFPLTPEEIFKITRNINFNGKRPSNKDIVYSFCIIYKTYKEEHEFYSIGGKEIFQDYYQSKKLFFNLLHSLDKQNSVAYEHISTVMGYLY
jgi:hypothetical protein